jgi:hypothetical protein
MRKEKSQEQQTNKVQVVPKLTESKPDIKNGVLHYGVDSEGQLWEATVEYKAEGIVNVYMRVAKGITSGTDRITLPEGIELTPQVINGNTFQYFKIVSTDIWKITFGDPTPVLEINGGGGYFYCTCSGGGYCDAAQCIDTGGTREVWCNNTNCSGACRLRWRRSSGSGNASSRETEKRSIFVKGKEVHVFLI